MESRPYRLVVLVDICEAPMVQEVWVEIRDDPDYEVSNHGNVRRKRDRRLLSQSLNKPGGYLQVALHRRRHCVHRLVFSSFFETCTDAPIVHIDGNKQNNFIGNLEQIEVTQMGNTNG